MDLQTHKKQLLKRDLEFRKEYETYDLAFEIGQMILEARSIKGVTQKRLAEMINTKQSSIARAERGSSFPSISFLNKIAIALKAHLSVRLHFRRDYSSNNLPNIALADCTVVANEKSNEPVKYEASPDRENTKSYDWSNAAI